MCDNACSKTLEDPSPVPPTPSSPLRPSNPDPEPEEVNELEYNEEGIEEDGDEEGEDGEDGEEDSGEEDDDSEFEEEYINHMIQKELIINQKIGQLKGARNSFVLVSLVTGVASIGIQIALHLASYFL